jgi:hypothetical protein
MGVLKLCSSAKSGEFSCPCVGHGGIGIVFFQLCLEVETVIIQEICPLHGANEDDDDDDDDAYDAICKTER